MRFLKILYNRFRELSINDFVIMVFKSLFESKRIIVYGHNLREIIYCNDIIFDNFFVEKGKLSDIEYIKQKISPLPWEFQCYLFDGVYDFFVAKDASGVQHISWIYYHDNRNRILRLGDKEAEIKFCFTLPGARGKGIYTQVLRNILHFLRENGISWAYICVYPDNYPSMRGIEKAGFVKIGEVQLKKILGIQISARFEPSKESSLCN